MPRQWMPPRARPVDDTCMTVSFRVSLLTSLAVVSSLTACQYLPPNQAQTVSMVRPSLAEQPEFKPWQLIFALKPTLVEQHQVSGFLRDLELRFGARLLSQMHVQNHSYVLLELDPQLSQAFLQTQVPEQSDRTSTLLNQQVIQQLADYFNRTQSEFYSLVELNQISETASVPSNHPAALLNDLSFNIDSGLEGWWREETQVEAAWNYSIGTGVKAAYIDQGFIKGHPELQRRMLLNGKNNQVSEYASLSGSQIDLPEGDHGTASLLVGFAERHNKLPSVGVAPNAQFTPYVAVTVWEAAKALQIAASYQPDVIGMNFAFPIYPRWQEHSEYQPYRFLKDVFADIAKNTQIPIVLPAHNYGEPIRGGPREWVPIAWNQEFDNIIGVGGVAIGSTGPDKQLKAWFNRDLMTGINARGSNYGEDLIWAPSMFLDIANPRPNAILPSSMSGTSAACPFVTAAVSLILSRLPELSAREVRDLFVSTARQIPADDLFQKKGATVPMIQVADALKKALQQQYGNASTFELQTLTGSLAMAKNGQRSFTLDTTSNPDVKTRNYQVLPTLTEFIPGIPSRFDQQTIRLQAWQGLPTLKPDELEIFTCCQSVSKTRRSE